MESIKTRPMLFDARFAVVGALTLIGAAAVANAIYELSPFVAALMLVVGIIANIFIAAEGRRRCGEHSFRFLATYISICVLLLAVFAAYTARDYFFKEPARAPHRYEKSSGCPKIVKRPANAGCSV